MKILLADDDRYLVELLEYALGREGYRLLVAPDGRAALERWESEQPDLVLLDVNLPRLSGFEVCRRIRREAGTPVILLTGRNSEEDVLRGFELGADDYVAKPFSTRQLVSRIEAVLRRARRDQLRQPARELVVGELVLHLEAYQASRGGVAVQLTPTEFRLLHLLAANAGRVIPYSRLIEYAWGYADSYGEQGAGLLKSHVSHLRQKLGLRPGAALAIAAVPGVGYRLTADQAPAYPGGARAAS